MPSILFECFALAVRLGLDLPVKVLWGCSVSFYQLSSQGAWVFGS